MNPYPSYKDSGVPARAEQREAGGEWIGEIPKGWVLKKIKYLKSTEKYSLVDGPFGSNLKTQHYVDDGDVYIIESGFITSGKFQFVRKFKTITEEHFGTIKRSQCREGDIIISKIGEYYGMCGILPKLDKKTVVSGNSITLTISEKHNTHFIHQVILQHRINGTFKKEVQQTGQPFISLGVVNNLSIPTPSLDEQTQIVSFLDHKTQKIDELVEKTEKKIELLKEKRTVLINHCVTKGLNPNVEMKDSGVPARRLSAVAPAQAGNNGIGGEWIGEIPKHWVVSKFKYLSKIVTGNTPSKTNEELYYTDSEDGFLWVKPTSLNKGLDYVNESEEHLTEEGKNKIRLIPKDSTMICCIGNTIGKHSISGQELSTNQQINTVIPNQQLLNSWFCLFYVNVFTKDLLKWSNFVTLPIYTKSDLEDTPFILPPIDEQDEIVIKLKSENKFIDSTIEKETKRIELLKEYRQSLISEVVTGKIDVRDESC